MTHTYIPAYVHKESKWFIFKMITVSSLSFARQLLQLFMG